jgi:FkbM family methyltransferase
VRSSGLKRTVRDAVCAPFVGRAVNTLTASSVPCHGIRIDTTSPAVDPRTVADIFWGFYERHELRFIRTVLRRDLDVIELGGSIGVTGAHILRRLNEDRRLVTVEANPVLIDALRRNLARQGQAAQFTIVNAAVDYSGSDSIAFNVAGDHVYSSAQLQDLDSVATVPTTTLARVRREHGVSGAYALFCDIERAEHDVLGQDADALGDCRQMIMEIHGYEHRVANALDMIERLGFRRTHRGRYVFAFTR